MTSAKKNRLAANNSNSQSTTGSGHELIPIIQSKTNELLVDGRLLHERLGVKWRFSDWVKNRIIEYGFEENKDFTVTVNSEAVRKGGGHNKMHYHFTIDTAKELAMVERNETGRMFRKYFIEAEKELRTKRLYATSTSITEIGKTIKPMAINGRKMYDYRAAQSLLGFSIKSSITNVRRAGYAGLVVIFNRKSYVSEEFIKVMMATAKTRALRAEARAAKPVLPANFGQMPIDFKTHA